MLASALLGCAAQQVRSLRPVQDLDSNAFLPELAMRLSSFSHLEELGPLCIDTAAGPVLFPPGGATCMTKHPDVCTDTSTSETDTMDFPHFGNAVEPLAMVSVRRLIPTLAAGFERCRFLTELDLTIRCTDLAPARAVADVLLPGLGGCPALRALRLDLDASVPCGALLMAGVARLLKRFAEVGTGALQHLSLGYLWWSEAAAESLAAIRQALREFSNHRGGGLRELVVRYPQDQELGALDAVCALIDGAAIDLEEVCILEGWGECTSLNTLAQSLGRCAKLRRIDILGRMPRRFDRAGFKAALVEASRGSGAAVLKTAPTMVCFNSAEGWRRAARATPSVSDRQRLTPAEDAPAASSNVAAAAPAQRAAEVADVLVA